MAGYGTTFFGEETYAGEPSSVTPVFTGTHFPELLLEEAFTTVPLASSPMFVDLGQNVLRSFNTRVGKSSDLDRPAAGTGRFLLDVRDRELDPANADGPYWPNIIPNRRVRMRAIVDGVTLPVFEGFADAHNVSYAIPSDAVVDLPATDAFKLFARATLTAFGARPMERSSARLTAILDAYGWPASRRSISTGRAVVAATGDSGDNGHYRNMSVLDAILEIDATEVGRTFVDADGTLVFLSRDDIQTATRQATSQVTFGDNILGGEIPYQSIEFENSETLLRNKVEVSHSGVDANESGDLGPVVVQDDTSIDEHGELSYSRSVMDAAEASMTATAEWFLDLYKDPLTRVLGVTVPTSRPTSTYPTGLYAPMLGLRQGDRVTVVRRPPGGGDPIEQDCYVESIRHKANAPQRVWVSEFGFSFAPTPRVFGRWGVALWGRGKWGF